MCTATNCSYEHLWRAGGLSTRGGDVGGGWAGVYAFWGKKRRWWWYEVKRGLVKFFVTSPLQILRSARRYLFLPVVGARDCPIQASGRGEVECDGGWSCRCARHMSTHDASVDGKRRVVSVGLSHLDHTRLCPSSLLPQTPMSIPV